ncbi:MAG: hypothetical protein U0Q03_23145 [Acidimicrobiales bacterium]
MPVPSPRVGPRLLLAALAVLVVGHVCLIVTRTYLPGGDWAFIDLRTRDVFSTHPPLTGAWSRYGWNHPGPILYLALALPRLLAGGTWRGVWIGAMLLDLAAVVVAWWLAGRRSATWAAAVVVAACWTVAAATPLLWSDPWNASVVVLPVLTTAAAVVAARAGDRAGVAVAMVVFAGAAQTHAAYGVLLLPAFVVVAVCGWRSWRRWTLTWLGVAVATGLPALIDTMANWPGNLWRALQFTATSDEPSVGLGLVARVIGRSSSLSFFTSPRMPSFAAVVGDPSWGAAPFVLLVLAVGAWRLARRAGWLLWQHVVEAVGLLWLGGALMTWRTRGPLLVWLTTWSVAVAALTWCVVVAIGVQWLLAARRDRGDVDAPVGPPERPMVVAGAAAVATVFALVNVVGSVGVRFPFQEFTPVVEQFADVALPLVDQPLLVDLAGPEYEAGAVQSALIARLVDLGGHPLGRPDQALQLGAHRVATSLTGRRLLVQVEPRSARPPDAEVLSTWDPLSADERAEADALTDELKALLDSAGLADRTALLANEQAPLAVYDAPASVTSRRADFERLGELHAAGPRVVLYVFPGTPG